jgi:hypothetical protein
MIKPIAARCNIVGLTAFFLLLNPVIIIDLRASSGFGQDRIHAFRQFGGQPMSNDA